ncbi:hypothetical protein FKP32DRAFT_1588235 [Trametes sanguinea]|nr:hypothetical protein FKP32DRAFT_1588235 [Trametes sanguinea]
MDALTHLVHDSAGFQWPSDLTMHVSEVHGVPRPYPCTEPGCNRAFLRKLSLKLHFEALHSRRTAAPVAHRQRLNTEARVQACPHCSKRFARSHNLAVHIRDVHEANRPHSCTEPGCNRAFARRHDLRPHVEARHGGRRHIAAPGAAGGVVPNTIGGQNEASDPSAAAAAIASADDSDGSSCYAELLSAGTPVNVW